MESSKDPISVRISQLNSQIVSNKIVASKSNLICRESLLDALVVLFDECNSDYLKRHDNHITNFVNKNRSALTEAKGLRVNLADFEIKNVIGRGHFGEVHVIKEKQTGDIYAMKTVKKSTCLSQKNTSYEDERNVMACTTSPWHTKLQYAFQDANNLYFVMEYHPGGDLFCLLHRQGGTIPESAATFYLAEIVIAINDLHNMGYVHRDIKPDNILLDRCGHIKLVDFGSSCKLNSKGLVSEGLPVGTPDYIAPEVLQSNDNKVNRKNSYGKSCDYWSLGILAYQLIIGCTPFVSQSTTSTYSKIMNYRSNLKFPSDIVLSQGYIAFIRSLLVEPQVRLNYEQILNHELFREIDFGGLKNQIPPYVTKIESIEDTSNFLDIPSKKSEPNIDNFKTKTSFSGKNLPFVGFTYANGIGEYKRSMSMCFQDSVKNKRFEELQKEVEKLRMKLMENKNVLDERENVQERLKDNEIKINGLENTRSRLEHELTTSVSEVVSLKRTLEFERKDRRNLESRALELLKSTKLKWEIAERSKTDSLNLEIEQQKEKIKQLSTTNTTLKEQLQNALKIKEEHKVSLEKVKRLGRQSVIGLECHYEKINTNVQNQISELQCKLDKEININIQLEKQIQKLSGNQKLLQDKLNISEENCKEHLNKLDASLQVVKDLENKIVVIENGNRVIDEEKNKNRLLEEENNKLRNNEKIEMLKRELKTEQNLCNRLKQDVQGLKNEYNNSTAKFEAAAREQKESYINQLKQLKEQLDRAIDDKNALALQLQEERANNQSHKLKVQTLEDLLKRLECGVSRLENDTDKESVLKEQVTRLEQQLIQVHELSALEKQELVQLKSKLSRVEKDFSNADIDKRILKRELKEVEEENKRALSEIGDFKMQIEEKTKLHEGALLELANINEDLTNEIMRLKDVIKNYEASILAEKKRSDNEACTIHSLRLQVNLLQQELASVSRSLEVNKGEKHDLVHKVERLESDKVVLQQLYDTSTKEKVSLGNKLKNVQSQLGNSQQNLVALRDACTLIESQLSEYEKLQESLEQKKKDANDNIEKLIIEVEQAKEETQLARRAMNEEKSLKISAEIKCKKLLEQIDHLNMECTSYKQQSDDYKDHSNNLLEQLKIVEDKLNATSLNVNSYERQILNVIAENRVLKEENSSRLTQLNSSKVTNLQLSNDIKNYKKTMEDLLETLHKLQESTVEQKNYHREREIKANATIKQQQKLIDLLQSQVSEYKKKKTLTEKIFGSSKKENQIPSNVALTYKDLEASLLKEKLTNQDLHKEIAKLKSNSLKSQKKTSSTPKTATLNTLSPQTKLALEKLTRSPSCQEAALSRQKSLPRMYHNIPHRFVSKLCTKATVCVKCSNQISIGRTIKCCTECQVVAHTTCAKLLPKMCGVPTALVKHYSESINRALNTENDIKSDLQENLNEITNMEGWLKIPVRGSTWEKYYACLTSNSLKIYTQPPGNTNLVPVDILEVDSEKNYGLVIPDPVPSEITVPVANSDLPFLIKVEVTPNTTCWPSKSLILMMLNMDDKEKWFKALSLVFKGKDEKYSGDLLLSFDKNFQVNCLVQLNAETILLGTDEGLYSYYENNLLRIQGPSKVDQIIIVSVINSILMIIDSKQILISCDLNHVTSLTKRSAYTEPTLIYTQINVNNLEYFRLFEVSISFIYLKLAVATNKQLALLNYDFELGKFYLLRVLDTAEPTSCILFTNHTVIVGADKFFEIDLNTFGAEEFLDISDPNLSQAVTCYKAGSFPRAILRVSTEPLEYLLCFHEFAFFVDEFGQCSRVTDIKWSRLPVDFHYHAPYLYIIQFRSVEIFKVLPETCNVMKNSLESLLNVESFKIEFNNVKFVGKGKKGIFVSTFDEIRYIEAKNVDAVANLEVESIDDDIFIKDDNTSERFSLTSSLMHSLDSEHEVESVETTQEYLNKRKVTFNVTSL